ncbi:MAG: NAD(P)H-quinone oxidoreductase subunit F, partial [Phycisphaeraceae bacterium]|nr:NAD(P)H-quinone oxidoreductase subunit F [Phycisphaeraceae bacterium]
MSIQWAKLIPWLPALAAVLCGLCCTRKSWRRYAGAICVGSIAAALAISVGMSYSVRPFEVGTSSLSDHVASLFTWFEVGSLRVQMAYFIDPLTVVMLLVVTGVGLLVAIYATGYMAGDRGYARFFAAVSLFIFAMTTLVLADNLVLLYLGWEGVGLCSYLLIGY